MIFCTALYLALNIFPPIHTLFFVTHYWRGIFFFQSFRWHFLCDVYFANVSQTKSLCSIECIYAMPSLYETQNTNGQISRCTAPKLKRWCNTPLSDIAYRARFSLCSDRRLKIGSVPISLWPFLVFYSPWWKRWCHFLIRMHTSDATLHWVILRTELGFLYARTGD